ncbi:AsnC family transcriptional regulator [Halomonas rhizosphaerae]|uniref:siroheme decarboxylase n=1 Tax=Halomonas rhizosphaerae TaxID=3043296 RepID=A0ABT6V2P9_9GAMM|nr:AsnC family transcriptional regulator [Halomonas rhizosphaerae]MDI5891202.1 AsnC family transcriptional regulator [Halomonas rhizosphaerae]MDI5922271.1 AsnC family transcriptional regulator [Halomonas rhizosphaerae]
MHCQARDFDTLDRRLIDSYQRGLPVCTRPFHSVAERLGTSEAEVISRLERLQSLGVLSRVGPVFDHARAGASLLAAVAVPEVERDAFAELINAAPGVNHNYAREHDFNLWFVMTAPDEPELEARLAALEARLGVPILRLPMLEGFHIDLSFPIPWAELERT